MKLTNTSALYLVTFILFILGSCKEEQGISKSDVHVGEKLLGLEFSKAGIDTMTSYLERNKRGYDSLRRYELGLNTQPPFYFDPKPIGFEIPDYNQKIEIPLDQSVSIPNDLDELAFYPITKLAALIKERKITSLELTRLYLNRLKKHNDSLQCVITFTEDRAIAQAQKADRLLDRGIYLGPLHGIPYGIKDLFALEGYPTTWGAEPYKDQVIDHTSSVINKLDEAGAILIAKLTSGALARGDVWFGGQTKNPWDLTQGASGSSAGSGAAMSAGLAAFTIGTETLGSIVSPANRNGVTGLRPTYGRVSKYGVMSLSWTMDKVGPLCRTAADCAIVLNAIEGRDSLDPSTTSISMSENGKSLSELKVAYLANEIEKDTTSRKQTMLSSIEVIKNMGLTLDPIELPDNIPYDGFDIILRAEAGAFFDELVRSKDVDDMVQQDNRSRANSLRQSRFIPAVEYIQANRHRAQLIEEFHTIISKYDVIITPTFGGRQLLITNLTGHPSICLPNGFDEDGRPTSITFVGNLYDESSIIKLAMAYQDATEHEEQFPPMFKDY